jgi:hypothetical protein
MSHTPKPVLSTTRQIMFGIYSFRRYCCGQRNLLSLVFCVYCMCTAFSSIAIAVAINCSKLQWPPEKHTQNMTPE